MSFKIEKAKGGYRVKAETVTILERGPDPVVKTVEAKQANFTPASKPKKPFLRKRTTHNRAVATGQGPTRGQVMISDLRWVFDPVVEAAIRAGVQAFEEELRRSLSKVSS